MTKDEYITEATLDYISEGRDHETAARLAAIDWHWDIHITVT